LTSGDKNFSDFPENQPTKFHGLSAVSRQIGTNDFYSGSSPLALGPDSTHYGESLTSSSGGSKNFERGRQCISSVLIYRKCA